MSLRNDDNQHGMPPRNDGRRAIDKQRAVQHYSDQQRIAELEKALQGLLDEAHTASKPLHENSELSIKARAILAKLEPQS